MIHLFGKCLVFARAAYGEISAFGSECGRLIAICGYSEFIAYAPCEPARELGALLGVIPLTGINGHTSVAPIRGCAP